ALAISSRFCLNAATHFCRIEASSKPCLKLPSLLRYSGISVTREALNKSSICLSVSWHIRPAAKRRPSSLVVGSLRPSDAVRLFFRRAWHTGQSASGVPVLPAFFQSCLPDHSCRFIFAPLLLVNQPPPPKVAPTSCTTSRDSLHVVLNGFEV